MRRSAVVGLVLVVLMGLVSAWAWQQIPEGTHIPVHWGASGQPDRYGGKAEALLVAPGVALLITVLFALFPRFDKSKGLEESWPAIEVILLSVNGLLLAVHLALVATALGRSVDVPRLVICGVGLLFLVLGAVMPRLSQNRLAGVRTPWSLASTRVWQRTHRQAGWIFGTVGAAVALLAGLGSVMWGALVLIVGVLGSTAWLVGYSYLEWSREQSAPAP